MSEAINSVDKNESNMVKETPYAYQTPTHQVHMAFDVPQSFDEKSFRVMVVTYVQNLISQSKDDRRKHHTLSDEELAECLDTLPSFTEDVDSVTMKLTKEDYSHFMRVKKPMKGMAKWL